MPAGMKYDLNPLEVEKELCNKKTIYRLAGGFNLVDAALVDGVYLPHLAPLAIDFTTRKAVACKNVKVTEAAASDAVAIKVEKGSLAYVGMILGTGAKGATVSAIDKTNANYDLITIAAAFAAALTVGQVLFEASAAGGTTVKNVCNFLNYARVKVEAGATVTAVGQAYEIKESKLSLPVSSKDKETLGSRFMFV